MSLIIKISGLDLARDHLARFRGSMLDMTDTMSKVGEAMTKYYSNEPFISRGGVYGQTWAPLANSTVSEKSRKWPGRGDLVRSGEMQDGFGFTVTPLSVTIRNKVQVSSKHGSYNLLQLQQEGTKHIPPRMVMALNETLQTAVEAIVKEDVLLKIEETR